MIKTRNHTHLKIIPIFIWYYYYKMVVQTKVLEFTKLKGETSDTIVIFYNDNFN